jgi:hypothetical protein
MNEVSPFNRQKLQQEHNRALMEAKLFESILLKKPNKK